MLKKNAKTRNAPKIASLIAGMLFLCVIAGGIAGTAAKGKTSFLNSEQEQEDNSFSKTGEVDDAMDSFGIVTDVDFWLSSGVAAWSTSLRINANGTFDGSYQDTDMGETGEEYPSRTIYNCEFSGKFKNLKKVNDYTYSFELDELNAENTTKREFIDASGARIVPAEPYGLETGKNYMLYLPNSEMSALPSEFVRWVSMPMAWSSDEIPTLLPFYGIYNVDGQYGFIGSKSALQKVHGN